jgi:flagellar biosynthesis protein FlhF
MQVRKFEAKTIKDAIELVKFHLGPEAIILSAKDNGKNFGLMGETSVEVTAAISEGKLAQKKAAEKKLDTQSKQKYLSSSARVQKQYIDRSSDIRADFEEAAAVKAQAAAEAPAPVRKRSGITPMRYIDIDEGDEPLAPEPRRAPAPPQPERSETRTASVPVQPVPKTPVAPAAVGDSKVAVLQNEIQYLRGMLEKFQSVPQNFITLHPGAHEGLPYELNFAFKKLTDSGLSIGNATEILKIANEVLTPEQKKKKALVDGWVIKYLLEHIQIAEKPFRAKYHVFVGPTGQGKTSTVVKMACHLSMKEKKKIAILSGDHVKIGAADQLKIYSQILNVPCGKIQRPQDWLSIEKALEGFDHILLDTPGVNLRTQQDLETLRAVLPPNMAGMDVHFVQSAMARDTDAFEVADRFRMIGFKDVIFTRLDEAVQHGLICNFQKQFNVPIHSFGIGNAIPEDYELATKERVVDLIFNLSKIRKERGL